MSLPFLQPKKVGSVLIARHRLARGGTAADVERVEEGAPHPGISSAMEDLIHAIHSKDASLAAEAFEKACEICSEMNEPGAGYEPEPNPIAGGV